MLTISDVSANVNLNKKLKSDLGYQKLSREKNHIPII